METLLDPVTWEQFVVKIGAWIRAELLTTDALIEVGILVMAGLVAFLLQKPIRPRLESWTKKLNLFSPLRRALTVLLQQLFGIFFLIVLLVAVGTLAQAAPERDNALLPVIASLMTAWILIQLMSSIIANHFVAQLFATFAWTVAALNIVGLLSPAIDALDSVSIPLGQTRITALTMVNGVILLGLLMWAALAISRLIDTHLSRVTEITPRARVLIGKSIRFVMIVVAVLVALSSVGINFAALAIFTGAVGVGIGIGLQKQVSNLISGIILLLDRSIKPGDVIEVGQTFGWVNKMSARYVGVTTRDNKELLIPNDDFVTHQVINWSHSNREVRMEVSFGVTYDCDPHKVREIAVEAASAPERVVKNIKPVCHLVEYGDSSLNFVIRFWITDPENGVTNIKGQVLLALWDALKENDIGIPYPHRHLIIENPESLRGLSPDQPKD